MTIRPASRADFEAIVGIDLSAGELFAGTHMSWAVGQHATQAQLEAALGRGLLWVAEIDGAPRAYLMAEILDGNLYIDEVAVSAGHQRRGLGAALIEHAVSIAQAGGHRAVTLTTDRQIAWNAPYYERLGFRIIAPESTPPELGARLASQPNAHLRCAMIRAL